MSNRKCGNAARNVMRVTRDRSATLLSRNRCPPKKDVQVVLVLVQVCLMRGGFDADQSS